MIQDEAPATAANKIWIDIDEQNTIKVPTYEEFLDVAEISESIPSLKEELN
jgi:hypothetical protein